MKRTPPVLAHRRSRSLPRAAVTTTEPTTTTSRPDRRRRHHDRPAVDDRRHRRPQRRPHSHRRPRRPPRLDAPTTSPTTIVHRPDRLGAVVQTLGQRRQDLYASPDVSRIPRGVRRATRQCAEQLNVQIADLASKGWRVVGADPYVVLERPARGFDGDTLDTSLLVTVVAVIQRPANGGLDRRLDGCRRRRGRAGDRRQGSTPRTGSSLGRVGPPEDPWRIISQDTHPEVPGDEAGPRSSPRWSTAAWLRPRRARGRRRAPCELDPVTRPAQVRPGCSALAAASVRLSVELPLSGNAFRSTSTEVVARGRGCTRSIAGVTEIGVGYVVTLSTRRTPEQLYLDYVCTWPGEPRPSRRRHRPRRQNSSRRTRERCRSQPAAQPAEFDRRAHRPRLLVLVRRSRPGRHRSRAARLDRRRRGRSRPVRLGGRRPEGIADTSTSCGSEEAPSVSWTPETKGEYSVMLTAVWAGTLGSDVERHPDGVVPARSDQPHRAGPGVSRRRVPRGADRMNLASSPSGLGVAPSGGRLRVRGRGRRGRRRRCGTRPAPETIALAGWALTIVVAAADRCPRWSASGRCRPARAVVHRRRLRHQPDAAGERLPVRRCSACRCSPSTSPVRPDSGSATSSSRCSWALALGWSRRHSCCRPSSWQPRSTSPCASQPGHAAGWFPSVRPLRSGQRSSLPSGYGGTGEATRFARQRSPVSPSRR